jgi:hypothetical protein
VRAFPVSPGRWLRVEGKLLTEVPWFFAAPTGANKVTVYWDGVPGATGYRVRWGTTSGSYPNRSPVGCLSGIEVRDCARCRLMRKPNRAMLEMRGSLLVATMRG